MAFCGGAVSGGPCLPALEHCRIRQFCAASTSRTRAQTFPKVEPRCCFPRPIQKASFPCLPISWLSFRGGENSTGAKAQALEQPLTRPESRHFKNSAFLPNSAFLRMQSECRVFKLHNAHLLPPPPAAKMRCGCLDSGPAGAPAANCERSPSKVRRRGASEA